MSEPDAPPPSTDTGPDPQPAPAAAAAREAEPAPRAESPRRTPYQAPVRPSRMGYVFFWGVLLLIAGLFWRFVEEETGWVTSAWIFLSIVAILVPFAWHLPDLMRSAATRRGTAFAYVITTIALGLVVALFVGWGAYKGKQEGWLPTLDMTKSARYSLSEESERLLDKVEGTIFVTYLVRGADEMQLRDAVLEQLRVFEERSSRIRFARVDEVREPEAARRVLEQHGVGPTSSAEDLDVIVLTYAAPNREVDPGKQKEIPVEQWTFLRTSSTGALKWLGEGAISTAIFELVFQKYRAYATGGHGEGSLAKEYHELKGALEAQNVEVASDPIVLAATRDVPDDCELLLVLNPKTPFTPDEAKAVSTWIEKGRTLFLTLDVADDRTTTGLDPLLDQFGIRTRMNYEVVAPTMRPINVAGMNQLVPTGMATSFPVYGVGYADHPAAVALRARGGLATFFMRSSYVEVDEDKPPPGAEPSVVCYAPKAGEAASPVALRHSPDRKDYNRIDPSRDSTTGKYPLVATSVKKPADPAGRDARLVVSGDSDVFSDRGIQQAAANLDLARSLLQWGLRREGLVAVSDRTLDDPMVRPDERQRRFAFWWPLAVVFLPLVFGGMVWWARRR